MMKCEECGRVPEDQIFYLDENKRFLCAPCADMPTAVSTQYVTCEQHDTGDMRYDVCAYCGKEVSDVILLEQDDGRRFPCCASCYDAASGPIT